MRTLGRSLVLVTGAAAAFLTSAILAKTFAQSPSTERLPSSPSTTPSAIPNVPEDSPASDAPGLTVGPFEHLSAPSPANAPEPVDRGPLRDLPVIPEGRRFSPVSCGTVTWGEQRNTGNVNLGRCN